MNTNQQTPIQRTPILQSKLLKPQLPQNYLERPEIFAILDSAPLLLVSATAGSGKSTAISAWIDVGNIPYLWYRLDSWDNDINQFLLYIATGISELRNKSGRTGHPETEQQRTSLAERLSEIVNSRMTMGDDPLIRAAIGMLQQLTGPFLWVFDDYHEVNLDGIHQFMSQLMQQLPRHHKVCIISREDPPLGFAKYRTQGRLATLREVDLRLTIEETSKLLAGSADAQQIQALHRRTEGWMAGIQLTVQSLQEIGRSHGQVSKFIEAYQASSAYMMDYLLEEVLERQSWEFRRFLMQAAVLDDFCPELVDYTLQLAEGESQMQLRRLVKSNAFILPTEGGWYRFHQLFRELLLQRLKQERNLIEDWRQLYMRAGQWFEEKDQNLEAIHYYLEGVPMEAARLIEQLWSQMDLEMRSEAWLKLAERLPKPVVYQSPVLVTGWGWSLLNRGDLQGSLPWFDRAERLLKVYNESVDADKSLDFNMEAIYVFDQVQFDQLPATLLSAKAYFAASEGDFQAMMHYNEQLQKCSTILPYQRVWVIDTFMATLHWANGDLNLGIAQMSKVLEKARQTLPPMIQGSLVWVIAAMQIEEGDLTAAELALERALDQGRNTSFAPSLPAIYTMYLAEIAAIRGDVAHAYRELARSEQFGQEYDFTDWRQYYERLHARLYCMQGMTKLAKVSISKGRSHVSSNPIPETVTFDDLDQWVQLIDLSHPQNRMGLKQRLLHMKDALMRGGHGDIALADIPYIHEFRWKLVMRYWDLALCGSAHDLYKVCLKLLERSKVQGRRLHQLEWTLLAARLTTSEREKQLYDSEADRLKEPECLVMPFLLWGRGQVREQVREQVRGQEQEPLDNEKSAISITEREVAILKLIARGYSNEQIAQELLLTLSTVKSYNNALFGKLGVKRRTEAIVKARVLRIIP